MSAVEFAIGNAGILGFLCIFVGIVCLLISIFRFIYNLFTEEKKVVKHFVLLAILSLSLGAIGIFITYKFWLSYS